MVMNATDFVRFIRRKERDLEISEKEIAAKYSQPIPIIHQIITTNNKRPRGYIAHLSHID
jgi:hypothetical protein